MITRDQNNQNLSAKGRQAGTIQRFKDSWKQANTTKPFSTNSTNIRSDIRLTLASASLMAALTLQGEKKQTILNLSRVEYTNAQVKHAALLARGYM